MFGHDNDDNNDSGQITLPPAQELDQSNNEPHIEEVHEASAPAPEPRPAQRSGDAPDELLDIKQQALQALTPLVDHLDQSPEEKFRTTMMMIQAADNHSLIRVAYEAAQQISSDKERAQALLDIVNEINYFTQQNQQS